MKEEQFDPEGLQALKLFDPIRYIETIVDRTVEEILKIFVIPPEDIRRDIRISLFQIMNTIYVRPDAGMIFHVNFAERVAKSTQEQTNLRMDFDDFYKKSVTAIQNIASGQPELRTKFETFLMSLMR